MAIDVVCGMAVSEVRVKFRSEYVGTSYYFCSGQCKETFDSDPQLFIIG